MKKESKSMKNNRGFTLVEAMVTILLFTVLFGATLMILLTGTDAWEINDAQVELQQELRKAMEWMKEDLRQAGKGSIINVPVDGNWYPSATFNVASGAVGGKIVWSSDTIQYATVGEQLQRTEGTQNRVVAQRIQSCQFRRQVGNSDVIKILLLVSKDTFTGQTLTDGLSFEVQLRN